MRSYKQRMLHKLDELDLAFSEQTSRGWLWRGTWKRPGQAREVDKRGVIGQEGCSFHEMTPQVKHSQVCGTVEKVKGSFRGRLARRTDVIIGFLGAK
jgi:hypothetical protein